VEAAAEKIAAFGEVSYLLLVSGEYDLIVEAMCEDREHLSQFLNQKLRKVPGVQSVNTFLILKTIKADYEIRQSQDQ